MIEIKEPLIALISLWVCVFTVTYVLGRLLIKWRNENAKPRKDKDR